MNDIQVKKAVPADIPLIAQLARTTWLAHYPSIITMEQIEYMLGKMYSHESLTEQMTLKGHDFFLCLHNGRPVGYISYSSPSPGDLFLHKFYLLPQDQKSGIGTVCFNKSLEFYPGWKTIRLTVNRQNFKSVNFYFKNGFIIEKVEDFDIGNGYQMNDFVMLKKALPA